MRRGLFILAVFILMAVSGQDAHAARFGTRDSYQHLQDLSGQDEGMRGGHVAEREGFAGRDLSGRPMDIFHTLPQEKIEQMQRAGALPNRLPPYRHTIFDYLWAFILWWCIPGTIAFVAFFQMLGIGSRTRGETRSA